MTNNSTKAAHHGPLSSDFFRALLEAAPDAMVIVNSSGEIIIVNSQAEKIFGYSRAELIGQEIEVLVPERFRKKHVGFRDSYFIAPHTRPMGAALELYGQHRNGKEFPVEISLSPLETEDGLLVTSAIRDVSARKESDLQLKRSLKEKEVLLKEVHHRVKNNLQLIASLLNMQSRQLKSRQLTETEFREIFSDTCARVRSIALIHEKLYQSGDLTTINLSEYVRGLTDHLVGSFNKPSREIELHYEIEDIDLDLDKIINCGLIINELVINALKYAFHGRETGQIEVKFKSSEGRVALLVRDNGIGLPQNINLQEVQTMGLQLVTIFARELEAELKYCYNNGAEFQIKFKA